MNIIPPPPPPVDDEAFLSFPLVMQGSDGHPSQLAGMKPKVWYHDFPSPMARSCLRKTVTGLRFLVPIFVCVKDGIDQLTIPCNVAMCQGVV